MNDNVLFYILILTIIIVEAFAIFFLKKGIDNTTHAIVGIILYTIVAILFLNILKRGKLGVGNSLWQAGAIIIVSIFSIVVFKEQLTRNEWIGMILAILAVITISLPS